MNNDQLLCELTSACHIDDRDVPKPTDKDLVDRLAVICTVNGIELSVADKSAVIMGFKNARIAERSAETIVRSKPSSKEPSRQELENCAASMGLTYDECFPVVKSKSTVLSSVLNNGFVRLFGYALLIVVGLVVWINVHLTFFS